MNISLNVKFNASKEEKEVIANFLRQLNFSCDQRCNGCEYCGFYPICDEFNLCGRFDDLINRLQEALKL